MEKVKTFEGTITSDPEINEMTASSVSMNQFDTDEKTVAVSAMLLTVVISMHTAIINHVGNMCGMLIMGCNVSEIEVMKFVEDIEDIVNDPELSNVRELNPKFFKRLDDAAQKMSMQLRRIDTEGLSFDSIRLNLIKILTDF